jgi:serine/threonine-protein kinase
MRSTTLGSELTRDRPLPSQVRPGSPDERYRHLQVLGRGGMGEVRLVLDRVLARVVAMKTVRRDVPTTHRHGERLLREAMLQARLQHPSVVPVYDLGHDEHGEPYFTMQRIRGRTLASVLGGLWADEPAALAHYGSIPRRLAIFQRVCEAVAWAHDHGIVHRDLKPDNVMLGVYGEVWVGARLGRREGVRRGHPRPS